MENVTDRISELHDGGRFDELYKYCRGLLRRNPRDMAALQNASMACLHLGKYQDAIRYADYVLERQPSDGYALKNKIYALENLGEYAKVLECCRMLQDAGEPDAWISNTAGLALVEMDRLSEAAECFEAALECNSHNTTALMNLGLVMGRLGRTEDSIELYNRALVADPSLKAAARERARAYNSLKRGDESFLAEQGMLDSDIRRIIRDSRKNNNTVFHQLCLEEMSQYGDADPHRNNPFRGRQEQSRDGQS